MRRRAILIAALGGALVLTGCNTVVTGRGLQSGVPTGGPPVPSAVQPSAGGPTATASTAPPAILRIGDVGTVTDSDGAPLADIAVTDVRLTLEPPNAGSDPPLSGGFLVVTIEIANIGSDDFAAGPLDFQVRYPGGTQVGYGSGSSGAFGFSGLLPDAPLAAGESAEGVIAFDVDPTIGEYRIAYTDRSGRVLGTWLAPSVVPDPAAPSG